ncbi:MAG: polysaccharide lyase family 8 super-sandwich domain-containing protein [Rikenellaceae bacterium]
MKFFLKSLFMSVLLLSAVSSVTAQGVDIIRNRLIDEALSQGRINDAEIKKLVTTFNDQESIWPGINYQDTTSVAFEHTRHLSNMVSLARAYNRESSSWYKNSDVKRVFDKSLGFWIENNFLCQNWWHNEIGTPERMLSILYTMNDDLSAEQEDGILAIAGRAHLNAWGARQSGDRIHIASLEIKQHIYRRDLDKIRELMAVIGGEVVMRNGERGLQADYSFHHRLDRVNNTVSYGLNFVNSFAEWVELVNGTEFQFSEEAMKLAIDYYLDGVCKHMVFGRMIDMNTENRGIARPTSAHVMDAKTPSAFMHATTYRKEELQNIVAARQGDKYTPSSFAKFYWETEHFAFQRAGYFTSVRMYSTRNANMEEPYNGEGLLNHFKSDGANYLALEGGEHVGITPYNDWQKIPGTTVLQLETMPASKEIQKFSTKTFVGGVDDGEYGAAAFDFLSPISGITAKKSWFFFDDEYVCLGADINSSSQLPLVTTIEQVGLDGKVIIKAKKDASELRRNKCLDEKKVEWVHHNNIGYYFPEHQNVVVSNQEQSGSWRLINAQTSVPSGEVKGDVFKMWIDHGAQAQGATYSYIVLPQIKSKQLEKRKMDYIDIIRNDSSAQAVMHKQLNILYVVFYDAGTLALDKKSSISVDVPSMLMVKFDKKGGVEKILASDPNRQEQSISVDVTLKGQSENYSVELPQGDYCGSSVVVK